MVAFALVALPCVEVEESNNNSKAVEVEVASASALALAGQIAVGSSNCNMGNQLVEEVEEAAELDKGNSRQDKGNNRQQVVEAVVVGPEPDVDSNKDNKDSNKPLEGEPEAEEFLAEDNNNIG